MDATKTAATAEIIAEEHWAKKEAVDLFMFRKRLPGTARRPVLFLVHGSSFSARTTYDLEIPGKGEFSMMNVFARAGFDVWTMDHEGYGRSSHTDSYSYVADGVEDLEAAMPVLERATGRKSFNFFGSSSGALRAGAFCNACPERVEKLALGALVWTGKGSPTLIERAKKLDQWRASNRRIVDEPYFQNVFTRDVTGLTDPVLPAAAAAAEMRNGGGSVPNGTYIDMCVNLPLVDPAKITCPVLIFRGDHDGIATDEDVLGFYAALGTKDKQYVMSAGQAHNTTVGVNRLRFFHVLRAFLEMPERLDKGGH